MIRFYLFFHFRFLIEFMEAGAPLTVLEIVKSRDGKDADKTEALKLILQIINSGRQYKEFLCENGVIRGVAECLGNSTSFQTQECCKQVTHFCKKTNSVLRLLYFS